MGWLSFCNRLYLLYTYAYVKDSFTYSVEYYFDDVKDESLTVPGDATEFGETVTITPDTTMAHANAEGENKNYVLVSTEHSVEITSNPDNNIIRVYYKLDELNDEDDTPEGGDGIPDEYQIVINYKVENGAWNDETVEDKKEIVTLKDAEGNNSEEGTAATTVPEVGAKPNDGYKAGDWKETPKEEGETK